MPAKSKKQQMAAGAALAAKRGKRSKSSLRGASRGMYKSMSEKNCGEWPRPSAKICRPENGKENRTRRPATGDGRSYTGWKRPAR